MNLQKLIAIAAVVVVIGGIVLFAQNDSNDTMREDTSQTMEEMETSNESSLNGRGSFATLIGLGKDLRCDFSYEDGEGTSGSGTSYVSGDRMRVDSDTIVEGEMYETHMINDGVYIYTWTDGGGQSIAMKMVVPDEEEATESEDVPYQDERMMTEDQQVEYDCDNWRVDASKFVPPADIEFMNMEDMFQGMLEQMPEGFEMPEGYPEMQ